MPPCTFYLLVIICVPNHLKTHVTIATAFAQLFLPPTLPHATYHSYYHCLPPSLSHSFCLALSPSSVPLSISSPLSSSLHITISLLQPLTCLYPSSLLFLSFSILLRSLLSFSCIYLFPLSPYLSFFFTTLSSLSLLPSSSLPFLSLPVIRVSSIISYLLFSLLILSLYIFIYSFIFLSDTLFFVYISSCFYLYFYVSLHASLCPSPILLSHSFLQISCNITLCPLITISTFPFLHLSSYLFLSFSSHSLFYYPFLFICSLSPSLPPFSLFSLQVCHISTLPFLLFLSLEREVC